MGYNNTYGPPPLGYQEKVSFGDAINMAFSKYAQFSGRSSRSEYWWWCLFTFLVGMVTGWFDLLMGTEITLGYIGDEPNKVGIISSIAGLALLIPNLALSVRRLHDIGKGGGWIFINCVPLVGWIVYLVFACTDSEMHDNRFGPIPNWRV